MMEAEEYGDDNIDSRLDTVSDFSSDTSGNDSDPGQVRQKPYPKASTKTNNYNKI